MEMSYLCPIIYTFSLSANGMTTINFRVFFINAKIYQNSAAEAVLEIFFVCIYSIYVIFTICFFITKIRYECLKIIENDKIKRWFKTNTDENLDGMVGRPISIGCLDKIMIFFKIVLTDLSNISLIINIILTLSCIILWTTYAFLAVSQSSFTDGIINLTHISMLDDQSQNNLISSGFAYYTYLQVVSLNMLFLFVKLYKIIIDIFPRSQIFMNTISEAADDLISFSILFITTLVGVIIFAYFFYGMNVSNYATLVLCILRTINDIFNFFDPNAIAAMYAYSPFVTFFYCSFIVIVVRFIFLKVLLSIIIHYYKITLDKYEHMIKRGIKYDTLTQKKILKLYPENIVMRYMRKYINCIHLFFDIIFCKICFKKSKNEEKTNKVDESVKEEGIMVVDLNMHKKQHNVIQKIPKSILDKSGVNDKSKTVINNGDKSASLLVSNRSRMPLIENKENDQIKENDHDEIKMSLVENEENGSSINKMAKAVQEYEYIKIKELRKFNIDFADTLNDKARNKYFESEKDQAKISSYHEEKYLKSFKSLLIYIFYSLTVIFTYVTFAMSPWHYIIYRSMYVILNTFPIVSVNSTPVNYNNTYILENVSDPVSAVAYLKENLYKKFTFDETEKNYYFQANRLINNSMLTTLRFQDKLPYFYLRQYGNLILTDKTIDTEFRDNMPTVQNITKPLTFTYYLSYKGLGGYGSSIGVNQSDETFKNFPQQILELMSFSSVEFFLENKEYNFISHTEILFTNNFGGDFESSYSTHYTQINPFQDILDYITLLFQLMFLVTFIFLFYRSVSNLFSDITAYFKWYREQITKMSMKSRSFRQRVKPEIIRFFQYLMDLDRNLDVLMIGFSIYYLICIVNIYIYQFTLYMNYDSYNSSYFDLAQIISNIDSYYDSFLSVGTLLLIVISLKLMKNIDIGEYFIIITSSVKESGINNLSFIIVLLLAQPVFVFFAYLSFGYNLAEYSTISNSIITIITSYFGLIDSSGPLDTDPVLSIIFFMCYMICMEFILSHFFVGIIDKAMSTVKEGSKDISQKYSIRRIFLFCCMNKRKLVGVEGSAILNEFDYSKKIEVYTKHINIQMIDYTLDMSQNHKNIEDFCRNEMSYLKYANDIANSLKLKQKQMELSYISKKGDSSVDDSLFVNIERDHLNCFSLFKISVYSKMINRLEEQTEMIHFYQTHLENFNKFNEFVKKKIDLKRINAKYANDILVIEKEFVAIFEDLKSLQNANNDYFDIFDETKKPLVGEQNEDEHEENDSNEEGLNSHEEEENEEEAGENEDDQVNNNSNL